MASAGATDKGAAPGVWQELSSLAKLASPVVFVQLGLMLMGTVDTMMLGRVSEVALAACALGNMVSISFLIWGQGILMGMDPLVAQAYGSGDRASFGRVFFRGLVLGLVVTVPISLLMVLVGANLDWLRQPGEIQGPTYGYLLALLPGNLAFLWFVLLRQTILAMNVVWPAVVAVVVANVFNVVANWALVFGHLGFPAMGVRGSGLATSASRWVLLLVLAAFSWRLLRPYWRAARLRASISWRGLSQLLGIGIPVGFHFAFEFYFFGVITVLIGQSGTLALAAHQVAINLASLSFMVPLGISAAATVRVGNHVGRGDGPAARRAAWVALVSGGVVMMAFAALFWFFPTELTRLYTPDAEVLAIAVVLLPVAAIFQVFDGLQGVAAGVLRGIADTTYAAVLAGIGFWGIGLPAGIWFASGGLGLGGAAGYWWGMIVGLGAVAILLLFRVLSRFRGDLDRLEAV